MCVDNGFVNSSGVGSTLTFLTLLDIIFGIELLLCLPFRYMFEKMICIYFTVCLLSGEQKTTSKLGGIHLVFSNLPWLQGRSLGLCLTHGDLGYLSMMAGVVWNSLDAALAFRKLW